MPAERRVLASGLQMLQNERIKMHLLNSYLSIYNIFIRLTRASFVYRCLVVPAATFLGTGRNYVLKLWRSIKAYAARSGTVLSHSSLPSPHKADACIC